MCGLGNILESDGEVENENGSFEKKISQKNVILQIF